MNLLAKFYKVSDINDWNLLEQEMDSQPVSRDKYSSCIENQNHVQVQKTVLNPYLETNMAAAKKSQNHMRVQEKVLNPYLETDTAAA